MKQSDCAIIKFYFILLVINHYDFTNETHETNAMNYDDLKEWIGKTETLNDQITLAPLKALTQGLPNPTVTGNYKEENHMIYQTIELKKLPDIERRTVER